MKKNNLGTLKLSAILVAIAMLFLVAYSFLASTLGLKSTKSVTRYDAITFNIMPGWKVYHKNQNYDIDIGYFQKRDGKETLLCTINAITANLNRSPSLEQFMSTTLGGKMFTDSHKDVKFKGLDAWRGTYTFPSKGIVDPAENDRLLVRYKALYVDITLSYNTGMDDSTKLRCNGDFEIFLENIILM